MRYDTHIVTSLCGGISLTMITDTPLTVLYLGGVLVGSLLPDIDEPKSYTGRRSPGVSHATKALFGHRGITHSLIACLAVALLYVFYPNSFVIGLAVGYFMHIAGDMFSSSGVPFFLPFSKKRIGIPLYVTGGIRERIIYVIAVIGLIFLSQWNPVTMILFAVILHASNHLLTSFRRRLHLF